MVKNVEHKFYVVYAGPHVDVENGKITQVHHVPVSSNCHSSIESAKKEYDELSARINQLLVLVDIGDFSNASTRKVEL